MVCFGIIHPIAVAHLVNRPTMGILEPVIIVQIPYIVDVNSRSSGVFLCIRCSGIHRGMGTHISKVKSVDLDVWTPEQMEVNPEPLSYFLTLTVCPHFQSIQKWGNHRANLYWEAHLKAGHIPPDQYVMLHVFI
jgi:hypothetical protein